MKKQTFILTAGAVDTCGCMEARVDVSCAKRTEKNFSPFTSHFSRKGKRVAFTLAEVLITLGVIGVVAALTLPSVIQNYKKHVVETRLAHFYSTFNQAFNLAESEFGDKRDWDELSDAKDVDGNLKNYNWYMKYLNKYIATIKIEQTDNRQTLLYFPNGSLLQFANGLMEFYPEAKIYKNCRAKSTCRNGIDDFAFFYAPTKQTYVGHYNKGVEPYTWNWDGTIEDLYTGHGYSTGYGCCETCTIRFYCTKLIQMNGWKIPKDYPLKF